MAKYNQCLGSANAKHLRSEGFQTIGSKTMKNLIASIFLLVTSTFASAGPFGLEMGMSKDQIRAAGIELTPSASNDGWYRTRKLPKNLEEFVWYSLWISPKDGLCKISAIGRTIEINRFGHQLKSEYQNLEKLVTEVYGKSKQFDFLSRGSIWSKPEDWAMALLKEERTLATFWAREEGSNMKDSLLNVYLSASALKPSSGYLTLG